jgi:endonuclease YncB( thermonuclease family)
MTAPEPGWITEVEYIRTIDGDTVEFEVRRRFKVRLLDIDVFESKTEEGKQATEVVKEKLENAKEIILKIPTNKSLELMDISSFERLLGHIYVNGRKLSESLRRAGFEKPKIKGKK